MKVLLPKDYCVAFYVFGTPTSISHYYINKTVTTSIDCNKLLILYNGTEYKEKRKENGIYLNANLHHATNNKNGKIFH